MSRKCWPARQDLRARLHRWAAGASCCGLLLAIGSGCFDILEEVDVRSGGWAEPEFVHERHRADPNDVAVGSADSVRLWLGRHAGQQTWGLPSVVHGEGGPRVHQNVPDVQPPDGDAEGRESVMDFGEAAWRSAQRLMAQLQLDEQLLEADLMRVIYRLRRLHGELRSGQRSSAFLRAAHPGLSLDDRLELLRRIIEHIAQQLPLISASRPSVDLTGGRAVVLALVAIERYGQQPDAEGCTDVQRDQEQMTDSLLRGLVESFNGADSVGQMAVVCPTGVMVRAMRSLQGFYECITIDGQQVVWPHHLICELGVAFRRSHPDPTPSQCQQFLEDARQVGEHTYRDHPVGRRDFEAQLQLLAVEYAQTDGL